MSVPERERQDILARIDALLQEAYSLPRTTESWERRLYIDWELFQLFRRLSGERTGASPSAGEHKQEQHPDQKLHPHDRPAQLPS